MKLKVSQAAADDLESIWLYTIEHWSMEQADRYLNLILDGFDLIVSDPKVGRDLSHVRKGYFAANAASHVIFYRTDKAAGEIEVVRVLHERMDIENRLQP
ncbi:MAG: type II toxin-antitoxin system RelE/ParE family toxin [Flavobacteriales bacterium]